MPGAPESAAPQSRLGEVHLGRAPGALIRHEAAVQGVVDVVGHAEARSCLRDPQLAGQQAVHLCDGVVAEQGGGDA